MTRARLIPSLLLKDGGLVKTERFARPSYVGDPLNAVRIFNDKEVDELMILDIDASRQGRGPDVALIGRLAEQCFMPLCYGGGIGSVDDAACLFRQGIEKVCLQSAALGRWGVVRDIADRWGSQAVMVSIDVRRDWRGRKRAWNAARRRFDPRPWPQLLREAQEAGAGEMILTAVDREGTRAGFDIELVREATALLDVPLIAAGGAGSLAQVAEAIEAGASAVAAGSLFVHYGPHRAVLITYPTPAERAQFLS